MRRNLIALACGVFGVLVALGAWHLYLDHQNHHALVNGIRAQAARAAAGAAR